MLMWCGSDPLAPCTYRKQSSDDRPPCLENPRPAGAESTLTENVASPFQAEPTQVAATLHPDYGRGPCSPSPVYPFTQTTWRNVCTTSTRSRCASITASMDLYAIGVSSMTSASLRHSTPAVALAWSSKVKRRLASVRDMARPAPWLQLMKLSGLPLPRTMYERAPMLPGMIPMSPSRARTAPLRVMNTFSP